ncbi:hypothetical protein HPP92_011446 [Vanilla planifolia]|uniref:Uncharacterized protein n=1 Tax=Vanilla planifolia TaxID=51239 RepID=A0A835R622_VANPL|nr:hypothetical protein HPP92_011446 [Vanilla planifolia]
MNATEKRKRCFGRKELVWMDDLTNQESHRCCAGEMIPNNCSRAWFCSISVRCSFSMAFEVGCFSPLRGKEKHRREFGMDRKSQWALERERIGRSNLRSR